MAGDHADEPHHASDTERSLPSLSDAMLDPDFMDAVRKLHRIWARRKSADGADTWVAIRQNLTVFARHVDETVPRVGATRQSDRKGQHEPS
jgi:hypothetical protein